MKKAFLLFLFLSCTITLISAQQKFEISVLAVSVNGSTVSPYSISIGQTVTLSITLKNEGAFPVKNGQYQEDSFPGGIYNFDYFVDSSAKAKEKVDFHHPLTLNGMAWNTSQTLQDTFTATAAFFEPGKSNIVIVWPGAGKAVAGNDTLDTLPKGQYNFYVYPEPTLAGIPNLTPNSFKIYPNPARDLVNIQMNETGTGVIRLMDMTGKLITSTPYTAKAGENISLPLNTGAAIPDGLYLIGIESGNGSQVSKIMICR